MADLFEISATETEFSFEEQREADTTFTVTNKGRVPMRVRARLVPHEQAQSRWYSMPGSAERYMDTAASETFDVHIALPPETGPGSYGFRLDVVDVGNPDENYELGPDVIVHIPEPEPPPVEVPSRFPWKIASIVGGVVLLCLGVLVWILMRGGDDTQFVAVPDVFGMPEQEARSTLENACPEPPCLNVVTTLVYGSDTTFNGRVISQAPDPNTEIEKGSPATIRVAGVISAPELEEWVDAGVVDRVFVERRVMEEVPLDTRIILCGFDPGLPGC